MMKKNIVIKNFKSREEAENVKTVFEELKEWFLYQLITLQEL